MNKICLFPGTFDPITPGHIDIIKRGIKLFDKIYIGIGINEEKKTMFTTQQRKDIIENYIKQEKIENTETIIYNNLTIECCKNLNINFILRGLRDNKDFDYEKKITDINYFIDNNIETFFMISDPKYNSLSSTIIRELLKTKTNIDLLKYIRTN